MHGASAVLVGCLAGCTGLAGLDELAFDGQGGAGTTSSSSTGGGQSSSSVGPSSSSSGTGGGMASDPIREDLVLLYHMDDPDWNGSPGEVIDSSGNERHATSVSATLAEGRFGTGGLFDGVNDELVFEDDGFLDGAKAFTLSVWARPDTLDNGGIVTKRLMFGNGGEVTFTLFVSEPNDAGLPAGATPGIYADVNGSTDDRFSSVFTWNDVGKWYHLLLWFNGEEDPSQRVRLYVDGQLDTVVVEQSESMGTFRSALRVGNMPGGGAYFHGAIDEVAIWRRALEDDEIAFLSENPVP